MPSDYHASRMNEHGVLQAPAHYHYAWPHGRPCTCSTTGPVIPIANGRCTLPDCPGCNPEGLGVAELVDGPDSTTRCVGRSDTGGAKRSSVRARPSSRRPPMADLPDLAADIAALRLVADTVKVRKDTTGLVTFMTDRLLMLGRVLDLVESIPADRLQPWHTVTVRPDSYMMAHPIHCELTACPFDVVARRWQSPPRPLGVYRWHQPDDSPDDWEEAGDG